MYCFHRYCWVMLIALLVIPRSYSQADPLRAVLDQEGQQLGIYRGETLLTAYKFGDDQKFPYFYPVNGPVSGKSVTTESSEPYPHHHSLWFGCDRVNGGNYWQEGVDRGRIIQESIRIVKDEGDEIVFYTLNRWARPGAPEPFQDERLIRVHSAAENSYAIDFSIRLTAQEEVTILQTNHSLFSARMIPQLSVQSGGTLVNSIGDSGEKETFGKRAPWMDYSGVWPDTDLREGLAILNHSANAWSPPPWFTRDYGFFSPTPMYWPENGSNTQLDLGQYLNLAYRVIVHSGDARDAEIADRYDEWAETGFPLAVAP